MKERAQAAAYDCFYLSVLGTVVLGVATWILDRDLLQGGRALVAVGLMMWLLDALYEIPATAIWGQTLGKSLLGIRVTALDGTTPGWSRAIRRWMFFIPFGLLQETAAFGSLLAGSSAASDPAFRGLVDNAWPETSLSSLRVTPHWYASNVGETLLDNQTSIAPAPVGAREH